MATLKNILALFPSDEMRHPYETAVLSLGTKVVWSTSLENLLNHKPKLPPLAVVVDLDALETPWESEVELLRTTFSSSDLIGFSSNDSAQMALHCIRSGFSDFLLKPVSPEEFVWSISKCIQRQELFQRLSVGRTQIVHALTQISTSTSPSLLRLCTLEYLQKLLESQYAAWVLLPNQKRKSASVLCSIPRSNTLLQTLKHLPRKHVLSEGTDALILRKKTKRKVFLPCRDSNNGALLLWDIAHKLSKRTLSEAKIILEHAEVCLLNLQKYEEIKHQTFIDDLTGLYNSRYLKFALNNTIQKYRQSNNPFAVLFIDVDHFKIINDRNGHLVGSSFLVAIGKTIRNAVRRIDPVFRYGGDEFVVILKDTSREGAEEIAERIRKHVERRVFVFEKKRIQTTVSIGIAIYPDHTEERETLLKLADEAMYHVKNDKRNAVHVAFGLENSEKPKRLDR